MANLLIADDDDNLRTLMCRALQADGHTVSDASDGALAMARFEANGAIDVLITDIEMPAGDGVTLATSAAAMKPDLNVILISGYAEALARSGEIRARRVETLAKPFALEKLRELVLQIVG
ncbi:MAG: response regulator [Hyphomicrobiaceae bacterium]